MDARVPCWRQGGQESEATTLVDFKEDIKNSEKEILDNMKDIENWQLLGFLRLGKVKCLLLMQQQKNLLEVC